MSENVDSETIYTLVQTAWTLFAAALVLFMQAGFCCIEAGSVRSKNNINVALKNIVDLSASIAAYFVIGFSLMFGATKAGWIGQPSWLMLDDAELVSFLFQATFCGTAATIVSGGIAERCRFLPYVMVAGVVGMFIYPVFGHWVWGGGWLSEFGFKDFAGSAVVHMLGAGVALAGIQILGARQGRFTADGKARTLPASSMPLVAIGVIILTFGWIGFNGGSAPLSGDSALIITNTILAACFGGGAALFATWAYTGLARAELVLNGVLGGLVAITACADCVSLQSSALIGVLGGVAVVLGTALMERLRLDDAVGAVPVHGVAGVVGILLTAVFMDESALASANADRVAAGKAEVDRMGFLGVQAMGAGVCAVWGYGCGLIVWFIVGRITQLRIGRFEETVGMNYSEHQVANPADELATAINLAVAGRRDEVAGRLDAADGELGNLVEAVRQLVDNNEAQWRRVKGVVGDLSNVQRRLDDKRSAGKEAVTEVAQNAEQLDGRLQRLKEFLADSEQVQRPAAVSVLRDLVDDLGARIAAIRERLPQGLGAFDDLARTTSEIEGMLQQIGAKR